MQNAKFKITRLAAKRAVQNLKSLILNLESGFTLVELLIAISITSTVSVVGISSFLSYNRSQTLNTAMLDVMNMLETARSRALTQIKPDSCPVAAPLDGYKVVIGDAVIGTNTYQLLVRCQADYQIDSKKLTSGISITPATLRFRVLGGGVDNEISPHTLPVSIVISGYNLNKTITVYADGRIIHD